MAGTTANADFEIQAADVAGTWIPLMLAQETDSTGKPLPKTLDEALSAASSDSPFSEWLEADIAEDFSGGVGVSYHAAPGCYTRTKGYVVPAGASTNVTIPAGGAGRIRSIASFGGDFWFAQEGSGGASEARVLRSVLGTGALSSSLALGAGDTMHDLLAFNHNGVTPRLYASWNGGGGGGLSYTTGGAWTTLADLTFGTNDRRKLAKVFWRDPETGVGAHRMVAQSGDAVISYTRPFADPINPLSWVEGVPIGTTALTQSFATARSHLFIACQDNLFDLDEAGNSPGLTSYLEDMYDASNGLASKYHDGYVYYSLGQGGLDRVYVGDQGMLQETPGICSPGWGTAAEHEYRGSVTALTVEQGYLVAPVYNPFTARTGIFWGKDRRYFPDVDTGNPLVWWGPEVVSGEDQLITAVRPASVPGSLRLFVASAPGSGTLTAALSWISMPQAGAPLDDLLADGPHRFATGSGSGRWQPFSRMHLMGATFTDQAASKVVHQHALSTRGLSSATGTKIVFETRADPSPGFTTWAQSDDVDVSPEQAVEPDQLVAGHKIERRVSFVSPSGTATLAADVRVGVLDAVRTTAFRKVPSFRVVQLTAHLGGADLAGAVDASQSPGYWWDLLKNLTEAAYTTIRDKQDKRWRVILRQVLDTKSALGQATYGKTQTVTLVVGVIGEAA